MMMKHIVMAMLCVAGLSAFAVSEPITLWKNGDDGIKVYRIPALCTAPNGDLVAACDARTRHGGDLNTHQPINITVRRSTDGGKTWTAPVNSYTWPWSDNEQWAGSDPSFIVDMTAKKIFLFYNVWECKKQSGIYQFWVQESGDNGKTWSKPRDISKDIASDAWPFGKPGREGFIFISSGSGIQTKDGTLLHTLVHVWDGNALFGSPDHGKTWKFYGKPAKGGDECKVVELANGDWMINSRPGGPGPRIIHVSSDRGATWQTRRDEGLMDARCNAQIMRYGKPEKKVLLFSNCNAPKRENLYLRASYDDGQTWTEGVSIHKPYAAYSDIAILPSKDIGILYEAEGRLDFVVVPRAEALAGYGK